MAAATPPSPSIVDIPSAREPRLRLFIFPHAGSGAAPFRPLAKALPPDVATSILVLPGREMTFGAPMFRAMGPLVEALFPGLLARQREPFVFFGHSLGGHVARDVAGALAARGEKLPEMLVTSASRAPHCPLRREPMHDMTKERFHQALRRYGGTPEAVLQNEELMELFEPPLRADLTIYETNSAGPREPLPIPITSFGGRKDHTLLPEDIAAWREHTTREFSSRMFEGGHFYVFEEERPLFTQVLSEILQRLGGG